MKSKKKAMWQLRCDQCSELFLFDKWKKFQVRHGWRVWTFCSRECKANYVGPGQPRKPMTPQTEADRANAINEVVREISARLRKRS